MKRNSSANRKLIEAPSLKTESNRISQHNLKKNELGIVDPSGKKENWSV